MLRPFGKLCNRFFCAVRANVAMSFALAAVPLVAVVGAGVDIARANANHSYLQSATDTAILHMAGIQPGENGYEAKLLEHVKVALAGRQYTNLAASYTTQTTSKGQEITINTSYKIPAVVLSIVGIDDLEVNATASAVASSAGSEVVFVLDTTGSMARNDKMVKLKAAVSEVLDNMVDAGGVNVLENKIGIVPFNTQVKVAPDTNYNWVNYGTATNYQYCNYGDNSRPMWPQCPVYWWNTDVVCEKADNIIDCKSRIKYYDKPVYTSGGEYHYEQIAVSYEIKGGNYRIYKHHMDYWWTDSIWSYINTDENGANYGWTGGSSGLDDDHEEHTAANLDLYNQIDTGYDVLAPFYWAPKYWGDNGDVAYENGFAADIAREWDYELENGTKAHANFPATADAKDQWTGCLIDRDQNYDASAEIANPSIIQSLYPARRCQYEPLETILGLTEDISQARSKVQALQPAGYTNITIGIQHGIEVLSPDAPFTGGGPFNSRAAAKYMVIVTDGLNNRNRFTNNIEEIDARTALACQAAKDKGITLFVVRLEEGNSDLLRDCASKPPYYYDLTSANQLGATLQSVFTSMNKLRLTK